MNDYKWGIALETPVHAEYFGVKPVPGFVTGPSVCFRLELYGGAGEAITVLFI